MENQSTLKRRAMELADQIIKADDVPEELMDELFEIEKKGLHIGEILSFITYERELKNPSEDGTVIDT